LYDILISGGDTLIGNRIRELRKFLNLTQAEFGERIGLKPTAIGQMENGSRNVTERSIILLCEKYNVNEKWIRTGEGDMFQELPPEDETAAAISNVLEDIKCENSIYTLVKEFLIKYERLDDKSKDVIENFVDDVVDGYIKKREEN